MSAPTISSFPTWTFDKHCPTMEWNEVSKVQLVVENDAKGEEGLVVIGLFVPPASKPASTEGTVDTPLTLVSSLGCHQVNEATGVADLLQEILIEQAKPLAKLGAVAPTLRVAGNKRFILFSLGPPLQTNVGGDFGLAIGAALATMVTTEKNVQSVACFLPTSVVSDTPTVQNLATGFYNHMYSDNRYRTGDNIVPMALDLKTVRLCSDSVDWTDAATLALVQGQTMARGVLLTRDIVNAPHNVLNSESLAETAKRLASVSQHLSCVILDAAACEARGMGAYLGVARGSETQPQFIHLTYTPPSSSGKTFSKKLGVVGKGLLFDTGGYNIKTSMMELMKFDCGGAAAVLGAARALDALAPPHIQVHFIVAACENMINHKAMVPSDILTASNGMTIEIMNTDAEGRLTLADALVYADKEVGCDSIIELSTLTGACMVALGKEVCGLWTNSDDLAADLAASSKATGDKVWRMPMVKEYREQLKSNVADIKNLGTPYGGSITAALFLQNFVAETKPFAHLDIAGPVWSEKTGATGFGAKLIVDWLIRQSDQLEG